MNPLRQHENLDRKKNIECHRKNMPFISEEGLIITAKSLNNAK